MRFNTEQSDEQPQNTPAIGDISLLNQSLVDFGVKKTAFEKMKKDLINDFRQSLNLLATDIFKNIPQLKAISWIQYTPYFNDGDECHFSIREIIYYNYIPDSYFRYAEEFDDEEQAEGTWAYTDYDLKKTDLSEDVIAFLKKFDSTINGNREFIKEIFGDHCKIVWTAEGVKITDYSDHN